MKMLPIFIISVLLIISVFFIKFTNKNNIQKQSPLVTNNVNFQEVKLIDSSFENYCFLDSANSITTVHNKVIKTTEEYNQLIDLALKKGFDHYKNNQSAYKLPNLSQNEYKMKCEDKIQKIDFTINSLLGNFAYGTCNATFNKTVTKNNLQKTINYKIKVASVGGCEMAVISNNWILIPSIEDDYVVNFEVN